MVLTARDRARFWANVDRSGGPEACWPWLGGTNRDGYGRFGKRRRLAHRIAWTLTHGPIPEGLHVLHHCDNPPCCNPRHLFRGDHLANMADMVAKGRQAKGCQVAHRGDLNGSRTHPERRPRGERHGRATLTVEQVHDIRSRTAIGGRGTPAALAREHGVAQSTITRIVRRKAWAHLCEEA